MKSLIRKIIILSLLILNVIPLLPQELTKKEFIRKVQNASNALISDINLLKVTE